MCNYTLQDILDARERRVELQNELRKKFNANILVVRVNYPGIHKDNQLSRSIVKIIEHKVRENFKDSMVHVEEVTGAEGPIIIVLSKEDPINIKKISIKIEEEHPLGRCVDMDVYNHRGEPISRTELGYESRRCFLCNNMAHICVRQRTHSEEDIIKFINNKYNEYIKCRKGEKK